MEKINRFFCKKLFTPNECIPDAVVDIADGKIASVKSGHADAECFLTDCTAVPGFVDLHIQGCGGNDFLDATPQAIQTIRRVAQQGGCTSLLATTTFENGPGGLDHLREIVHALHDGGKGADGATIIGIHLEGPYLNVEKKGGFGSRYFRPPSKEEFQKVLEITGESLKMITVAPELEGAGDVIRMALERGIVVSLGHTTCSFETAAGIFDMGANHVTHFFNAMMPLHHRDPGLVGAALERDDVFLQLIPDGIHIHPAVLRILFRTAGGKRICLITDATAPCGMEEGTEIQGVGGLITVQNGAVRLPDGTLAGSALLMDEAVRRMHRLAGIPLESVFRMASLTPSEALCMDRDIGSARPGARADFTLTDDDLKVRYVIQGGTLIRVGK